MSTVRVTAIIETVPGKADAFLEATKELIVETRKENGCIDYQLFKNDEQDNSYVFIEEWETKEALEKHSTSAHITAFRTNTADSVKSADVQTWHTAPTN